jgi:hypothetical protein
LCVNNPYLNKFLCYNVEDINFSSNNPIFSSKKQ